VNEFVVKSTLELSGAKLSDFNTAVQMTFRESIALGLGYPYTFEYVQIVSALDKVQVKRTDTKSVLSISFKTYVPSAADAIAASSTLTEYLAVQELSTGPEGSTGFLKTFQRQGIADGTEQFTKAVEALVITIPPSSAWTLTSTDESASSSTAGPWIFGVSSVLAFCCVAVGCVQLYLYRRSEGGQVIGETIARARKFSPIKVGLPSDRRNGSQAYTAVGLPAGDEQGLLKETPTSASAPVRVAIVEEDYDDETESMQIL